jgi:imidazolonepropionase-like amidohydrolase
MIRILSPFFLLFTIAILGQNNPSTNGVHSKNKPFYVFENAVIHIDGDIIIENGTLIIQDNKITYVGNKTKLPKNSIVEDLEGKHIYPSFIELNSNFGMKEITKEKRSPYPQYHTNKKGPYYWNQAIKTEVDAFEYYTYDDKKAKELRKLGFGTVLSHQQDGISRGTGALVSLTDVDSKQIISDKSSLHFAFSKGSSRQAYPSSLMGIIALMRQYFYDSEYYKLHADEVDLNLTLQSQNENNGLSHIIDVNDKLSILRADKLGDEFNKNYIIIGNGDEYQEISAIKKTEAKLIVPLQFPKAYDIKDPFDATYVTLEQLKHWELAPANLSRLEDSAIVFSITSSKLEKGESFLKNLRKAVQYGLSPSAAINGLTKYPAQFINNKQVGMLIEGKLANFIITSNDILLDKSIIHENWVQGKKHIVHTYDVVDIRGEYNLNTNQIIRTLKVSGELEKPNGMLIYNIVADSISSSGDLVIDVETGRPIKITKEKKVKVELKVDKNFVSLNYNLTEGSYRLGGNINFDSGSWDGKGQIYNGDWINWTAIRKEKNKEKETPKPKQDSVRSLKFNFPMIAYGWDSLPKSQSILIKNATVWTLEEQGTIQTDVLIQNGKIVKIASILDVANPSTRIIDGTGMHLTPGIIDEHSHIAIQRGVNEGSHAVTAEVKIGDVIRNNDINIYRQLAGGVTACQLLHGSANPVGGQSALIKLRWGLTPEQMKIKNADGFIKFALGENVKQSNWGNYNTIRFPQTRMGVEQVYYDAFIRAREYETTWTNYNALNGKKKAAASAPKRDIQMDALVEILNSQRFVSCHSYVQSEINMLIHVADSLGFRINTFTHILEGYKVADKMKEHGAGGSTFSDWWGYKYEVRDAIPYNASLLNQIGITTAINSDDAEMGRRLNQEAAKGIKYGGMSEEEALKMVTLNPAKLLHLDDRMGSIKVNKDADVVLWTAHPLSIYAKVQNTIIDGVVYFDAENDKKLQKDIAQERQRIINKMLAAVKDGDSTQEVKAEKEGTHVCTSIDENEK